MLAKFFIVALTIFGAYRMLHFATNRIPMSKRMRYYLSYIFPSVELFSWLLFLIWVLRLIYKSGNYFTIISIGIVLVLLFALFFALLRDYILGFFLKLQNKLMEGSFIEIGEIKGQIKKAGHFRLDIEDNHGNIGSVPYYNIRSKVISHYGAKSNLEKVVLEFAFPDTMKVNETTAKLKNLIMSTPWVAVSQTPIVENVKTENGKLIVEVGAYTLSKSYEENIRKMVEAQLTSPG